jgi:ketosteroid isomerase-like protein
MRRRSFAIVTLGVVSVALTALSAAAAREQQADADVIATERAALERWGNGDPGGFLSTYAPEIAYIDPTTERRIDGIQAMTAYLTPLKGKIHIDRFEILNPKVQRSGDVAVLSYNIINYQKQPDGTERQAARWNSTAVFRRIDGKWKTIHSHFSYTKPELK